MCVYVHPVHSFESALAFNLSCFSLRVEQKEALKSFVLKKDVFAVLRHRKGLIYKLALLVGKRTGLFESPLVVIVSPIALMEDQA